MYGRGNQDASEALDQKAQERLSVPAGLCGAYKDIVGFMLFFCMGRSGTMESYVPHGSGRQSRSCLEWQYLLLWNTCAGKNMG